MAFNPNLYLQAFIHNITLIGYGGLAIIFLFFPLAGFLADIKYGRYKTVVRSLFFVLISMPMAFYSGCSYFDHNQCSSC